MIQKIYCCHDTISNQSICVFSALTDGVAVRDNAVYLSKMHPLTDLVLYHIADFDTDTREVTSLAPRAVSWDSYKFPENSMNVFGVNPQKNVDKK